MRPPTDLEIQFLKTLAHRVAHDPYINNKMAASELDLWLVGSIPGNVDDMNGKAEFPDLIAWDGILAYSEVARSIDFSKARKEWEGE